MIDETANASSNFQVSENDVHALRQALKETSETGGFQAAFQEPKEQEEETRPFS